jgi:hypothetical protein
MIRTRAEILQQAQSVELEIWRQHLAGFIDSFIKKDRRDRWRLLLLNPSVKTSRASHKLYNDIDRSKSTGLKYPFALPAATRVARGVYDDLQGLPKYLTYDEATIVAPNTDGIYSFIAGELAMFWFHEGEVFLFDTRSSTR